MNHLDRLLKRLWEPSQHHYCYQVEGFDECRYYHMAINAAKQLEAQEPNVSVQYQTIPRQTYAMHLQQKKAILGPVASRHNTCPLITEGCDGQLKYVGGYTDFAKLISSRHQPTEDMAYRPNPSFPWLDLGGL